MKHALRTLGVIAMLAAGQVAAHPNHDDENPIKLKTPPATVRHSVEAVTKDGKASVSISRAGAKVSTANAMGVLVVPGSKPRVEYVLDPAGDNTMVTREKISIPAGTKTVVAVSLADRVKLEEEVTLR